MMSADRHKWTREQIEEAKRVFKDIDVPSMPGKRLIARLWENWLAGGLDTSFFDAPEHDLALVMHARAHGLVSPADRERVDDLLARHREWYEPLVPPRLFLGALANLTPELGAALDSQVMDAWVLHQGSAPVKILIIGTGVPQLADEVLEKAFMLSLRAGTLDTDLIGVGAIRVDLGSPEGRGFDMGVNPLGADPMFHSAPVTGREAMNEFVTWLFDLADRTGLIRVHRVDDADQRGLLRRLRDLVEGPSGADAPPVVWTPENEREAAPRVAALLPCFRLPAGTTLRLRLSLELLDNPAYLHLREVYVGGMLGRIMADVEVRYDYHTSEISRLRREHNDYLKASEDDRLALWGEFVYLNYRYDFDADVAIRLQSPLRKNAEAFYLDEVPRQIEAHEKAAERMAGIRNAVRSAPRRSDQPIERLTAGRFFDAAMRGRDLATTATLAVAYTAWKDQVSALLWFEWRRLLRSLNIKPEDVFTPHTVVQTFLTLSEIIMTPFTLVDQDHSAILLDSRRGVMVTWDVTDRAGRTGRRAPEDTAETDRRFADLAAEAELSETEFDEALLALLRTAPVSGVARILQTLGISAPDVRKGKDGSEPDDQATQVKNFQRKIDTALSRTTLYRNLHRALEAAGLGAHHTARLLLVEASEQGGLSDKDRVRIALAEAVVEFWAGRQEKTDPYKSFSQPITANLSEPFQERFRKALRRAKEAETEAAREYAEQWIDLLRRAKLSRVVWQLLDGLPEPRQTLEKDQAEFAALASRTGAETARLARELIKVARKLSASGEAPAMPFAKIGQALDEIFLAEYAGGSRLGAIGLLEILTRMESQADGSGQEDGSEQEG